MCTIIVRLFSTPWSIKTEMSRFGMLMVFCPTYKYQRFFVISHVFIKKIPQNCIYAEFTRKRSIKKEGGDFLPQHVKHMQIVKTKDGKYFFLTA